MLAEPEGTVGEGGSLGAGNASAERPSHHEGRISGTAAEVDTCSEGSDVGGTHEAVEPASCNVPYDVGVDARVASELPPSTAAGVVPGGSASVSNAPKMAACSSSIGVVPIPAASHPPAVAVDMPPMTPTSLEENKIFAIMTISTIQTALKRWVSNVLQHGRPSRMARAVAVREIPHLKEHTGYEAMTTAYEAYVVELDAIFLELQRLQQDHTPLVTSELERLQADLSQFRASREASLQQIAELEK